MINNLFPVRRDGRGNAQVKRITELFSNMHYRSIKKILFSSSSCLRIDTPALAKPREKI